MSQATDYLENKIIDHVLRATAFASPATVYLALFTAAPSDAGGGTEVSGGGYARQAVTFVAPTNGATDNSEAVTFPAATANWGTISHWAIFDAASAGNMLIWGAWTTAKAINSGDTAKVNVGDLDITVS